MRISFELPIASAEDSATPYPGFIHLADQEVFFKDRERDIVVFKFDELPGFRIEPDGAPCALLSQSFFLKAIAIVANPELAKELA